MKKKAEAADRFGFFGIIPSSGARFANDALYLFGRMVFVARALTPHPEGHGEKRKPREGEAHGRGAPEAEGAVRPARPFGAECELIAEADPNAPEHDAVDEHRGARDAVAAKGKARDGLRGVKDVVGTAEGDESRRGRSHSRVARVEGDDVSLEEIEKRRQHRRYDDGDLERAAQNEFSHRGPARAERLRNEDRRGDAE